jgi:hypothetical protein
MTLFKLTVVGLIAIAAAVMYGGGSSLSPEQADEAHAEPTAVVLFNGNFCIVAGLAFAGLGTTDAVFSCGGLYLQGAMQTFISCVRGADVDQDATVDCVDAIEEDDDGVLDVEPEDFAPFDLDANQVHAGQFLNVIAFVDDDAGVRFLTDVGNFRGADDVEYNKEYACTEDSPGTIDPDCDGDPSTIGDGVVVARLFIDADDPRGEAEVIAIQDGVGWPSTFTVTGPPERIELAHLFGKDKIQVGGTAPTLSGQPAQPSDCNLALSVEGVLGAQANPYQTIVVAKAFDDDDVEIASAGLIWQWGYNGHGTVPGTSPYADESDLGGVSTPLTPTVDTGALGLAFPELVCSKNEVGTLTLTAKFDWPEAAGVISGTLADENADATIDVEVLPPPGELSLVANPPALECNGLNTTTVTATALTTDGRNVANGNDVEWNVAVLGNANPLTADTTDGVATTVVTPLAPAGTGVPVIASIGEPTRFVRDSDNRLDTDRTEPNPDYVEASLVVQCVAGTGAPPPGEQPAPGGQPGPGGRPGGVITGPDTGTSGELAGSGPLSIWSAVMLFVGAMGLIGARFALRRS